MHLLEMLCQVISPCETIILRPFASYEGARIWLCQRVIFLVAFQFMMSFVRSLAARDVTMEAVTGSIFISNWMRSDSRHLLRGWMLSAFTSVMPFSVLVYSVCNCQSHSLWQSLEEKANPCDLKLVVLDWLRGGSLGTSMVVVWTSMNKVLSW